MVKFLVGRLAQAVAVVFGVMVLTFLIARLVPGDPAIAYAGPKATPAELAAARRQFGLDDPPPQQLLRYLGGVLRGDWGTSLHTKAPVLDDLVRVVPTTLVLVIAAIVVAVLVGVPLGIFAARSQGRLGDVVAKVVAILSVSFPVFWLALLLQLLFFSRLGWFPVAGQYDPALDATSPLFTVVKVPLVDALLTGNWPVLLSGLHHLALPVATLAAYPVGACAMVTRAAMLDNLAEEHVRMVRALGFSERSVLTRFALRPSLSPILSIVALVFAYSLTNSFIVESVFNWPGLGSYAIDSIQSLDVPAILGVTLFVALIYVALNLLVDLCQAYVDPRVRS
ncbi:ABC transporter permease [Phycicoccus sp. Soil803]|uniref:ABC transporter permease n=1 Tax=Phycicoccus sp. Soil803 TaxID=1736415 RepID=UPI00070D1D9C|nr:ABC transporter permease [Phycicoccus sp. Soil803]KRF24999.1 peptide ABC transporter permease [Phycicoccus sp. Soil803]